MYTEAKTINILAGESIGHLAPGGTQPTYEVPPGVYTFSWFEAAQTFTIVAECSGTALYAVDASILAGTLDILIESNSITVSKNCLVQIRPESYENILRLNSFKAVPGTLQEIHDDPYNRTSDSRGSFSRRKGSTVRPSITP